MVIIYFLAIIPVFPLKNFIDEYYLDLFYSINKIFTTNEIYLGKKSEGYPPLIKWEQREKDSVEVIHQYSVQLVLQLIEEIKIYMLQISEKHLNCMERHWILYPEKI